MFEQLASGLHISVAGNPLVAFAVAFAAGFLVSLTPCVYPMLPITVGYIGGGVAGAGRARGFALSAVYVLGLAVTYSTLGVVSALMNKVFGFAASNPWTLIVVGAFFVAFGLSMMDLFMLPIPSSLQNIQPKARGGYAGAFLIGVVSGLIAAPCSTPVLLAILTHIAQRGGVVYGVMLMFTYAAGLGALIVVFGAWAGASKALPKSGVWMVWVKRLCGLAIIAAGAFYIITSASQIASGWKASAPANRRGPVEGGAIPNINKGGNTNASLGSLFFVDRDTSRIDSLTGKQPVFLVFFGTWCVKCGEETDELNALYDEFKNTSLAFFAVDINDPEDRAREFFQKKGIRYPVIYDASGAYMDKYQVISAPTLVIISRDGKELYHGADALSRIKPLLKKAAGKQAETTE